MNYFKKICNVIELILKEAVLVGILLLLVALS
jgi:hypothetical protein